MSNYGPDVSRPLTQAVELDRNSLARLVRLRKAAAARDLSVEALVGRIVDTLASERDPASLVRAILDDDA